MNKKSEINRVLYFGLMLIMLLAGILEKQGYISMFFKSLTPFLKGLSKMGNFFLSALLLILLILLVNFLLKKIFPQTA